MAPTSRHTSTGLAFFNFEFSVDNARNLVILNGLDNSFNQLLLAMGIFTSFCDEYASLITSVTLGQLFTEGEYFLVQVD